ncbi:MAG TPA: T9SS type A sorting domain-containing protein [Saprospiraceae bacterium]|nr:T9SS type A sorting domain-containing protein [Saprospiraceae bacterium]
MNAQITLTAHDLTPQWVEPYGYGSNMGVFFPNYYDMEVATLLCGNAAKQVEGIGATTIRPALFEFLVDYFGYDIRLQHFNYYKDIGAQNVTCFVGNPSEAHRDPVQHCPGRASAAFKNMYTPIWDNGENGTPVNDTNYYAVFCWKMATMYKDLVRIWEITNEPDLVYDWVAAGSPPGTPGNWWENPADPCTYQMSAPVYYYIRMLRISYEVMKGVDPSCRIATGGIGWPSFLDQLCRYTDNPDGGKVSPEYPLTGGAYFDCLSFHTYPHIDGSMRKWDNSIGGFKYSRHSDRAVEAIWELRDRFKAVLDKYGYDGSRYPEKLWICTEYSLPRKAVGDYIGSDAAQCNFIIKTSVTAQQQNMAQMHYYSAADETPEGQSASEFAYMGFFKNLSDKVPYQHERNLAAYAHQTVSEQLRGKTYDPQHTAELNLPTTIRGGAFRDEQGNYTYALWAVTQTDMSEEASATYSFPAALGYSKLEQHEWNHAQTHMSSSVAADQVPLKGSPVFLSPQSSASTEGASKTLLQALLVPNPSDSRGTQLVFRLSESGAVSAQIFDAQGRPVQQPVSEVLMSAGVSQLPIDVSSLPAGTYFLRLSTPEGVQNLPLVRM